METVEGDSVFATVVPIFTLLNGVAVVELAEIGIILFLILAAALVSGSESAFFSLGNNELLHLKEKKNRLHTAILYLHERPKRLLATILIANTFINIMIAILATSLLDHFDFGKNELLKQFVDVVIITFTLVLLGEVVPKIYASHHNLYFASVVAFPLIFLTRLLYPFSAMLIGTTYIIERRMKQKGYQHNVSLDDIKSAIEITSGDETTIEEKKILKGIINFGNTYVKQIMRPRTDVVAHDVNTPFDQLVAAINENRYSRLPIYDSTFDHVVGILYIKDLIAHLHEPGYEWNKLIKAPYFIPESKKIDALLQEFKQMKVHMAIVVDEYGGTAGLVTLEDILEEIVGDINDEFDDDEMYYSRLDDENFVFDGKTSLSDVVRIMDLNDVIFDEIRGEAETIGGLMIELGGRIPDLGQTINYGNFAFTAELSDRRSVKRVKVSLMANATPLQDSINK